LYAIALGWPEDGKLRIKTLARGSRYMPGEITKVEMLGSDAPLKFERSADALVVTVPAQRPNEIAYGYRITPTTLGV
jgi:alpha-L-fucosidase